MPKLEDLTRRLQYGFTRHQTLRQALTHRSHSSINNERLEFLGDSVLNCAIAHELYRRFPKLPEGDLSRLRAHLVKESTLFLLAQQLELGEHLLLGEGELKSAGWRRPSVLADALEALIGAVFLDSGFDQAALLVQRLYAPLMQDLDPKAIGKDPKTLLQEYLQARKLALPEYALVATEGEAHQQIFHVVCRIPALNIAAEGSGGSRRAAEQVAAETAYREATHD